MFYLYKTYLSSLIYQSLVLQSGKTLPKPIYIPQLSYVKLKIEKNLQNSRVFQKHHNQENNHY